jgi:hypothetical protein
MAWDAGDIHGPQLASQQEKDAPSDDNEENASNSNEDKGKVLKRSFL